MKGKHGVHHILEPVGRAFTDFNIILLVAVVVVQLQQIKGLFVTRADHKELGVMDIVINIGIIQLTDMQEALEAIRSLITCLRRRILGAIFHQLVPSEDKVVQDMILMMLELKTQMVLRIVVVVELQEMKLQHYPEQAGLERLSCASK